MFYCETLVALWLSWSWESICLKHLFSVLSWWVDGQMHLEWLSYWLSMFSSGSLLGGRYIAPGLAQTCQFNLGCKHITTVTTSGRRTGTGSDMSIQFDPKLPPAILHLLPSCTSANYTQPWTLYAYLVHSLQFAHTWSCWLSLWEIFHVWEDKVNKQVQSVRE